MMTEKMVNRQLKSKEIKIEGRKLDKQTNLLKREGKENDAHPPPVERMKNCVQDPAFGHQNDWYSTGGSGRECIERIYEEEQSFGSIEGKYKNQEIAVTNAIRELKTEEWTLLLTDLSKSVGVDRVIPNVELQHCCMEQVTIQKQYRRQRPNN